MSTKSSFRALGEEFEDSEAYWRQAANLGFVYGVERLLRQLAKSRTWLAKKAKKDLPTVSRELSGTQNLTIATMTRLARALDAVVYIHVERREIQGGWVPLEEMRPAREEGDANSQEFELPTSAVKIELEQEVATGG